MLSALYEASTPNLSADPYIIVGGDGARTAQPSTGGAKGDALHRFGEDSGHGEVSLRRCLGRPRHRPEGRRLGRRLDCRAVQELRRSPRRRHWPFLPDGRLFTYYYISSAA